MQQGAPDAGLVLMEGGHEEYRHESDTEKLFRQESSFAYLFGVRSWIVGLLDWRGRGGWFAVWLGRLVWAPYHDVPSTRKQLHTPSNKNR